MTDWDVIKRACAEEGESLRSLAARFQIPYSTLRRRAVREGWYEPQRRRENEYERVGRKLLRRIENCLDEGKEIDLKEIKAVTGALRELQTLEGETEGDGSRVLTVRFVGEAEEMSR